jgi:hypothetical protein
MANPTSATVDRYLTTAKAYHHSASPAREAKELAILHSITDGIKSITDSNGILVAPHVDYSAARYVIERLAAAGFGVNWAKK